MLKIKNITAVSESQSLLKDINLEVKAGEIHAIMGPKHSGKTALAHVIAGHPSIQITDGNVTYKKKKLLPLEAGERSKRGIFTSMQYPPEFEGITNWELLEEIFSARGEPIADLKVKYTTYCEILNLGQAHAERHPNSGQLLMGEAKRNELLHMLMLSPDLVVLDEIDQGLGDEETVLVAAMVKDFLDNDTDRAAIVITHNQQLLDILEPTHVHVMVEGEIRISGGSELYTRIVEDGYSEFS